MDKKTKMANLYSLYDMAEMLGCDSPEKVWDQLSDNDGTYSDVLKYELGQGLSDEEAEEKAQKAEQEALDESFAKYTNALVQVFTKECGEHGLEVTKKRKRGFYPSAEGKRKAYYYDMYAVTPKESWKAAAELIRQTINGYGMFYFQSTEDFLSSGPYTAKQAVLQHMHWMKERSAIYAERNPASAVEEAAWGR